jgi:hypothetical protein
MASFYTLIVAGVFLVLDIRRFQRVIVIFCRSNVSHVWVQRVEGDIWRWE